MEYIESSGTQVIDTGIPPSLDLGILAKTALIESSGTDNDILFGCTESGAFANGHGIGFDFRGYFYEGVLTTYRPIPQRGDIIELEMNYLNDGRGKVHPIGANVALAKDATYTQLTIAIFNFRTNNITSHNRYAARSARIYGIRFTRGDRLILDMIPVVKDGKGYLFDTISERFYGNVGSGDFIVGPRK